MKKQELFDHENYQNFIRDWISRQPSNGRGQLQRLANTLGIHSSTLSQVLSGTKSLTLDQASLATEFFGLNEIESQFFLLLVLNERAGTTHLQAQLKRQMKALKKQSGELATVIPQDRPLSEEEKAIFYSNWYYTAIWAQTDIPGYQTREELQHHFRLPRKLINDVVSFLVKTGLCIEKNNRLKPGHNYTHLDSSSPLLSRHHANWRLEAMKRHASLTDEELCYTSPMTISAKDAAKVRKLIIDLVAQVNEIRGPSPSEELRCFNIDWIRLDARIN